MLSDSNFVRQPSQRLDSNKTVFVGALHGMMTAEALANIMNDLFANVVYAGIDTDKHKYPIGQDFRPVTCNMCKIVYVRTFVKINTIYENLCVFQLRRYQGHLQYAMFIRDYYQGIIVVPGGVNIYGFPRLPFSMSLCPHEL